MRARVLLGAAVVLLAAAIWLWRGSAAKPERVPEPERADHARPSEPPVPTASAATAESVRPTLHAPADEAPPPRPTASDQRDATSASEPTFKQETLRAIREAATPQLLRCIDETFTRSPQLREQSDLKDLLSAVLTVSVTRGQVTVREARVSIHRFHDDALVHCAEQVYTQLRVLVPATQGDGDGVIEVGFDGT